jgi:hypothetical protein
VLIDRQAVSNPDQQPTGESASPEDCPEVLLWEMIAFTPVDGANRKSRDSKWVSKKWKGGVLAVSPVGWAIFLDPSQ